jgi:hypothetical protein
MDVWSGRWIADVIQVVCLSKAIRQPFNEMTSEKSLADSGFGRGLDAIKSETRIPYIVSCKTALTLWLQRRFQGHCRPGMLLASCNQSLFADSS